MSSRAWPVRRYEFRPPTWQPRSALNARLVFLGLLTVAWAALYVALGMRLWSGGIAGAGALDLLLALLSLVLGAPLAVAWWVTLRRWRTRLQPSAWPPLTVAQLLELSPSRFEEYVAQRVFARQGYIVENTPDVADGGVDIIVTDRQGNRAIVQCKRYRNTVGEATVRDLYGAMIHHDAGMAFLVTTAKISDAARRWAADKPIALIDGAGLEALARAEPVRHP